jgi:hypothetical protein
MRRLATVLAACVVVAVAMSPIAASAHGGKSHALSADVAPTITATAAWDSMGGGINVHIITTKFTFAPQSVGQGYVQGQGHAHLSIDGNDVGRAYGPWVFIPTRDFGDGDHTLRIALEANDHGDYMVGPDNMSGDDVEVDVKFTVPKGQGFGDNLNAGSMAGMDMSAPSVNTSSSPAFLPWVFALGGIAFGGMLTWVLMAGRRKAPASQYVEHKVSV